MALFRGLTSAALLAAAAAEPMVSGGTLKLTWSDCGSPHGKAQSVEPSALVLGQATKIVGKGTVDEDITSGTYDLNLHAGVIPLLDHKGDICKPDSISLPAGLGTMQWAGLKCAQAKGPVEIDMSIQLSASIPASMARTSIKLTATSSSGDNLLCIQLNTAPADEADPEMQALAPPAPAVAVGAALGLSAARGQPALAEPLVSGGTLKLTWSDCGSPHGKAQSVEPSALVLGQATKIVGKGTVDEDFTGGGYELNLHAGLIPLLDHKGDICKPDSIALPAGLGTMQWAGLHCPQAKGAVEIDMSIQLSAVIPASMARTSIKLTATSSSGDDLLCIQLNTAPEDEFQHLVV